MDNVSNPKNVDATDSKATLSNFLRLAIQAPISLTKKTNSQTNKKTKNDNHDVTFGFESQSNWVSGVNNDFSRIHNLEEVMGC